MNQLLMGGSNRDYRVPQNLLTSPGSVFEAFEDAIAGTWTLGGTGAAAAVNTTEGEFRTGNQSIKLTSPTGTTAGSITRTISWVSGGAAPNRLRVSFYCHSADPVADITYIRLYLADQATVAPNSYYSPITAYIVPGWNTWDIYPADWVLVGTEDWATEITLRLAISAKAGMTFSISFDEIRLNPVGYPAAMIYFMDDYDDSFVNGFGYMNGLGLHGSYFITVDEMNGVKGLTDANLVTMDAAGWSIGNFGNTYVDLDSLSTVDATANLAACTAYLDGLGLTRASLFHQNMSGPYIGTTYAAFLAAGITLVCNAGVGYPACSADNNLVIKGTLNLGQGFSGGQAAILAAIDLAASTGRLITLYVNKVLDVPGADTYAVSTADFQAIVDYIREKKMPLLSFNDFVDAQSGAISIPR